MYNNKKFINKVKLENRVTGLVILNYFSFFDTITLVSQLQNQTCAGELLITIVDNASPNESYARLKPLEKQYSNVVVLQTGENLGYAKGNNIGLKYLDEHVKPDYVAVLNNDIQIPENCLELLIKKYREFENPAIIAPKMLNQAGLEIPPYKMNTFFDDCINLFYLFKVFPNRNKLKFEDNTGKQAMKVDMVPGSFMFASFETFKNMGFFYPHTFLFVEERFIAMKAKMMGLCNYIILDLTYFHFHSKTINTAYNQIQKYRLLYNGWLEFTRVYRRNGRIKAAILKPLMHISLCEMRLVYGIASWLKKLRK